MIISYETQKQHLSQYIPSSSNNSTRSPKDYSSLTSHKQSSIKIQYSALKTIDKIQFPNNIKFLTLNYCHLKSLSGIEQFVLLQTLEAKYNHIEIISYLSHNRGLMKLNLIGNKVCRNGAEFVKQIESMRLKLVEINGVRSSQFKRIYQSIQSNVKTSIETERDHSQQNVSQRKYSSNRDYKSQRQVQRYQSQKGHNKHKEIKNVNIGSIDDIDAKLQNCANWFHVFSLYSKAFVGLKQNMQQKRSLQIPPSISSSYKSSQSQQDQHLLTHSDKSRKQQAYQNNQNASFQSQNSLSSDKSYNSDQFRESQKSKNSSDKSLMNSFKNSQFRKTKKMFNLDIDMINAYHQN